MFCYQVVYLSTKTDLILAIRCFAYDYTRFLNTDSSNTYYLEQLVNLENATFNDLIGYLNIVISEIYSSGKPDNMYLLESISDSYTNAVIYSYSDYSNENKSGKKRKIDLVDETETEEPITKKK